MMNAVRCYPEDRSAFQRQGAADSQEILHPLRSLVPAMGKQAMIAHANSQASCDPPERERGNQGLPGEKEKRRHRAGVKCNHECGSDPVNLVVFARAFQRFHGHSHEMKLSVASVMWL